MTARLLAADEPPAFRIENEGAAKNRFLLTADHAGRRIPRALGDLGVAEADLRRHIAWDIGIAGVTSHLARMLGAEAVFQNYSRLVGDCNRQPSVPSAFPVVSEAARSEKPVYVAMHSFTPVYLGVARPVEVAVLYNRAPRFSHALAALLRSEGGLVVAENEPYRVTDETDYGVPVHAERGGLDYVEIEIRQDLIAHEAGQLAWAERLARLLPAALARIGELAS
jgi:predicted N-formylglutamate amidohydrolase